jgi:hypothetical protein
MYSRGTYTIWIHLSYKVVIGDKDEGKGSIEKEKGEDVLAH